MSDGESSPPYEPSQPPTASTSTPKTHLMSFGIPSPISPGSCPPRGTLWPYAELLVCARSRVRSDPVSIARDLVGWACDLRPDDQDLALADRSLLDTVAVAVAARAEPVVRAARGLPEAA